MTEHDHDRFLNLHCKRVPHGWWIGPGFLVGLGLWALIGAAVWAVM